MMTPLDDFVYLINQVLLGEEPTIEDFILLIGTVVAFVAFVLWCCCPATPREMHSSPEQGYQQYNHRSHKRNSTRYQHYY